MIEKSADVDVKQIRMAARAIGKTQRSFAEALGVPVKTVSNWEQGRRKPTGPALVLLRLVRRNPALVFETTREGQPL